MFRFLTFSLLLFTFCNLAAADYWNGSDYAQNSSVQQSHGQRLFSSLSLKGNEKILDVGCGDGKLTVHLAERVPQGLVIGIDPSDSMLFKAQSLKQASIFPNLFFFKGWAENFSFAERFDHIIAIHVMHWIKNQEIALSNIYSHLKPGGQVHLILAPSKEGLPFYRALQKTVLGWKQDFENFDNPQKVFDMETYRKYLIQVGFHIDAIHYVYHESVHENKDKLKAWIQQWLPHGKHLPIAKQSTFFETLMDHYLAEIGLDSQSSAPVRWGEYVLIVEATKRET